MEENPFVVIMAGGIGSRFWPYSRDGYPKQFLDILGTGRTMLQMTYERFAPFTLPERLVVVTNSKYKDLVKEQLPAVSEENILCEPTKRDTATCIAYASYKIRKRYPEATVIVTPSDHMILNESLFQAKIKTAVETASDANLVTIGIQPNRPDTGYGYIQYIEEPNALAQKVKTFTEKPNAELAETFLQSGDFVWNSGIFVWKNKSIIHSFERYLPELAEVFEEGEEFWYTPQEQEFILKAYSLVKNLSIDYGVMEKSDSVYVVLGDFTWADLGSWKGLYELQPKDQNNNVVQADALLYDTRNTFVKANSGKLVVVHGLDNYLINESDNVLLICNWMRKIDSVNFSATPKTKGRDSYNHSCA